MGEPCTGLEGTAVQGTVGEFCGVFDLERKLSCVLDLVMLLSLNDLFRELGTLGEGTAENCLQYRSENTIILAKIVRLYYRYFVAWLTSSIFPLLCVCFLG